MIESNLNKKQKISEQKEFIHNSYKIGEIDTDRNYSIYLVPIELLTLNPHNNRFQSKFLSSNFKNKSPYYYQEEGQKQISEWILNQSKAKNLQTKLDIQDKGQQEPGLITADGLIINGNRRFVLLKKLYNESKDHKYSKFKVVILNDLISSNYEKIKDMEIRVQYGKDRGLGYPRMDLMLVIRRFKETSKWSDGKIQEKFDWTGAIPQLMLTLKYIDDYLVLFNLKENYQLVSDAEDQFKYLSKNHKKLKNDFVQAKFQVINWKPGQVDFEDFKYVLFKLLRFKPDQHTFRPLVETKDKFNILSDKSIWQNFKSGVEKNYDKSVKAIQSYQQNKENNKETTTPNKIEEIFKHANSRQIKDLCLQTEHAINSLNKSGKLEVLLDNLNLNISKINDFVINKKEDVKDNFKKKLKKSIENISKIIETIEN